MRAKTILATFIAASGMIVATPAFSIGKTGNNRLFDSQDKLSVKIPADYPFVSTINNASVILRSASIIRNQQGFLDQASFHAFSFRNLYQNLTDQPLDKIKGYFVQASKMSYQVVYESSEKIILLGQNEELIVGVVVAPGGRGVVFEGIRNEIIKQGILDTMNGVVFQ